MHLVVKMRSLNRWFCDYFSQDFWWRGFVALRHVKKNAKTTKGALAQLIKINMEEIASDPYNVERLYVDYKVSERRTESYNRTLYKTLARGDRSPISRMWDGTKILHSDNARMIDGLKRKRDATFKVSGNIVGDRDDYSMEINRRVIYHF